MPNSENIDYCDNCGNTIDMTYDEYFSCCDGDCGNYRCVDCGSYSYGLDDYPDAYGIHSWDYKPHPYSPKGNYPSEVLLGVELEVGGRARNITTAVHAVDDSEFHLYMKEDGSIDGVEIVTHPMTLAWAHENGNFARLLSELRHNGAYTDDGYGLHVHVSRNAFRGVGGRTKSASHQMAWLMFLYRNTNNLQALARRTDSRWARFTRPRRGELLRKAKYQASDDRYVAVNCNNDKTYELRFFQSTLSSQEFFAAIEFSDASVEYTRTIKTSDILRGDALRWSDFTKWIGGQSRYHNLAMELAGLDLADEPTIIPNGVVGPTVVRGYTLAPGWDSADGMSRESAIDVAGNAGLITRNDAVFVVYERDNEWRMGPVGYVFEPLAELAENAARVASGERMSQAPSYYVRYGWRVLATAR